jgi:hypothetical protein
MKKKTKPTPKKKPVSLQRQIDELREQVNTMQEHMSIPKKPGLLRFGVMAATGSKGTDKS